MDHNIKTHNRIKEVREAKGLSQAQLGRLIGKSEPTVNRYERGNRKPTRDVLNAIAQALGVPLKSLFVNLDVQGVRDGLEGEPDGLRSERSNVGAAIPRG